MTEMRLMDADTKKLGVIRRRAETLSDEVSDRLRAAIISRELTPGERLTEANLAERLGVSKTPVREALMHLVEVGLVESFGGRLHVVRVSTATIRDAYEMRLLLEVESVRLASQRHSEEDSVSLLAAARDTIASANEGVLSEFLRTDCVFHEAVAACSGNEILARALRNVLYLTTTLRLRDVAGVSSMRKCAADHGKIVNAVNDRDSTRSVELMRAHIESVRDNLLSHASAQVNTHGPKPSALSGR